MNKEEEVKLKVDLEFKRRISSLQEKLSAAELKSLTMPTKISRTKYWDEVVTISTVINELTDMHSRLKKYNCIP